MSHFQQDEFGNILCTKCEKPCCPVTGTNLAGVCWACANEWKRQMREKAQKELKQQAA